MRRLICDAEQRIGDETLHDAGCRHEPAPRGIGKHGDFDFRTGDCGCARDALCRVRVQVLAVMLGDQNLSSITGNDLFRHVLDPDFDPFCLETLLHHRGYLFILATHDPWRHLHLGDLDTEAVETLGQLRTDRSTAQHYHPAGFIAHLPEVVRGIIVDLVYALDRWHEWAGTGGDDATVIHALRRGAPVR